MDIARGTTLNIFLQGYKLTKQEGLQRLLTTDGVILSMSHFCRPDVELEAVSSGPCCLLHFTCITR